jgi:environmental stress-induced protein Ves
MFTIIHPQQFKTLPWKNGKGETIELAINDNANLNNFEWRISMASVVEDGVFSDFSGYMRNLILIEGKGLNLQHDHNHIDKLNNLLEVATFDGACSTVGNLHDGAITDFNVITAKEKYRTKVSTYFHKTKIEIKPRTMCFIYSLSGNTIFSIDGNTFNEVLPEGHLLKISEQQGSLLTIEGEQLIVVELSAV